MNRHGSHNIRNGIVWEQTGHNTGTCTATWCVIELSTHQKFESFKKIFFATTKFEFESANLFQKHPNSFEFISGRMVWTRHPSGEGAQYLSKRPGQAVANSYTVHSSPFVFAFLCFFGGWRKMVHWIP